jgi:hypothetical protein
MKVAIITKPKTVMNWAEDVEQDLILAGHSAEIIPTRHRFLPPIINNFIYSDAIGSIRAGFIIDAIKRFKPDLIIAIGAYQLPGIVLEAISTMRNRAPFVGWVGNRFGDEQVRLVELFDLVAYSDSGVIADHRSRNLKTPFIALNFGACAAELRSDAKRENQMIFIGNPNAHRRAVLNSITSRIDIYGPRWDKSPMAKHHNVHSNRVAPITVRDLYKRNSMTLNMKSEAYNIDGLNQRHFAPYLYGCVVVAESMKDIDSAFERDEEMFVWSSENELNELYARLLKSPDRVAAVAEAGKRRVLSEHLYRHRLQTIMKAFA